jgi:hypothetical protein
MDKCKATVKVIVKCPICQHRIFDKYQGASGIIELKCPVCHNVSKINLSFRLVNRNCRLTYRV